MIFIGLTERYMYTASEKVLLQAIEILLLAKFLGNM